MIEHKDAGNNPIKQGDFVAYAVTSSRSAVIKFGRVIDLCTRDEGYTPKRIINTLSVLTVEADEWQGERVTWKLQNKGRPLTIMTRASIVVPPARVPATARAALMRGWACIDRPVLDGE